MYISKKIIFLIIVKLILTEDYYRTLGLSRNATKKDIRRAFKKLSLKYHPDKNKDNPELAKKKFIKIANAYEVLNNEKTKKIYDQYGEEGLKQYQQQQNAGGGNSNFDGGFGNFNFKNFNFKGGNFGGFNFGGGDFGGMNFEDLFSQFFGGSGNQEFHFSTGGHRAGQNFKQNFNKRNAYDSYDNKNYFKNTDIINIKMNSLSKIYNRKNGWFILFFNSRDREFQFYSDLIKSFSKNTKEIFTTGVVNCKSDEEICDEFSVKNTPKILYFPDDGSEPQTYNGEKTWKDMFKFASNQLQNYVKVINNNNYNDFLKWHPNQFHVILFTSQKSTPALFKVISKDFLGKLTFGEIRESEKELCKIFDIKKFPSLIILTDEEEYKYELFNDKMDKAHIEKFLNKYSAKKKEINKVLKIRELNLNLYNKNFCNNKDGKNTCFIYFSQGSKLTYNEKKLLENIGNKYLNDKIVILYLNPKNYPNFWKSFDEEDKNCKAVIIKGKRNKYYPINKEKFNEKELINIIDNIISGGGDNKKLIKPLNLNKNDYGDL